MSVSVCAHAHACVPFSRTLCSAWNAAQKRPHVCVTQMTHLLWARKQSAGHPGQPGGTDGALPRPPRGRRGAEGAVRVEGRGTKPRGGPARPRGAPSGKRCSPAAAFVLNSRGKKLHQRFAAFHLPSDLRPSSWRPRPFHPAELHTLPPRPRGVTTSLHQVFAAAWQLSSGTSPRLLAPTLGQERGLSVQGTPTGRSPSMRQLSQETLKPSPEMLKH